MQKGNLEMIPGFQRYLFQVPSRSVSQAMHKTRVYYILYTKHMLIFSFTMISMETYRNAPELLVKNSPYRPRENLEKRYRWFQNWNLTPGSATLAQTQEIWCNYNLTSGLKLISNFKIVHTQ